MVLAEENLTVTLAVASSVAVFMFAVLIGVIIVGITCNRWFDKYQSRLGRGKVPRIAGFWKKKKKSTHHSMTSIQSKAELNNYNSVIIPTSNTRNSHTDTWIKKWANDTRQYEEVSKEIHLGEEGFDEVPLADVIGLDVSKKSLHSEETGEISLPTSTGSTVIANNVSKAQEAGEEIEEIETDQAPISTTQQTDGDIDVVIL